jgi:hypothetical protein
MSIKNPMTLAGIEPVTFRYVAQHLNHSATVVPDFCMGHTKILGKFSRNFLLDREMMLSKV